MRTTQLAANTTIQERPRELCLCRTLAGASTKLSIGDDCRRVTWLLPVQSCSVLRPLLVDVHLSRLHQISHTLSIPCSPRSPVAITGGVYTCRGTSAAAAGGRGGGARGLVTKNSESTDGEAAVLIYIIFVVATSISQERKVTGCKMKNTLR